MACINDIIMHYKNTHEGHNVSSEWMQQKANQRHGKWRSTCTCKLPVRSSLTGITTKDAPSTTSASVVKNTTVIFATF
jgi:hypothetical protein